VDLDSTPHYANLKKRSSLVFARQSSGTPKVELDLHCPIFLHSIMLNCVRFEVFTVVTMKNAVFWDGALCRSAQSAATCSLWFLARGYFYSEDGGYTFLPNVGSHKIYTAPHLRRQLSS
jgi:hypothetical protein